MIFHGSSAADSKVPFTPNDFLGSSSSNSSSIQSSSSPIPPRPSKPSQRQPTLNFDRFTGLADPCDTDGSSDVLDKSFYDDEADGDSDGDAMGILQGVEDLCVGPFEHDQEQAQEKTEEGSQAWTSDEDELLYQHVATDGTDKEPTETRTITTTRAMGHYNAPIQDKEPSDINSEEEEEEQSASPYEMVIHVSSSNSDPDDPSGAAEAGPSTHKFQMPDILSHAEHAASWEPAHVGPSIPILSTEVPEGSKKRHALAGFDVLLKKKQEDEQQRQLSRKKRGKQSLLDLRKGITTAAPPPAAVEEEDDEEASIRDHDDEVFDTLLQCFDHDDTRNNSSSNNNSNSNKSRSDDEVRLAKLQGRFKFEPRIDPHQGIQLIGRRISQFGPHHQWHALRALDLTHQKLTAIIDLEDILPRLEALDVSNNSLSEIARIPSSLQSLKVKSNRLMNTDAFRHLNNLQYLDICNNAISDFRGVSHLTNLRYIHAEFNKITSCRPFRNMRGLIHLNLRSNAIKHLGFQNASMDSLETLDVSYNRVECLEHIEGLVNLRTLMLDHNDIKWIQLAEPLERLKVLKISYNRLKAFDGSSFPDLRTLYMDDNQIMRIIGLSCIPRMASFSLRDQGGHRVELNLKYVRGARKLYLSGNPIKHLNDVVDFFTLEYLEVCAIQLEELPPEFARQVPNLGVLYLSHNYLKDIRPLRKLRHLRKLVLIDNRIDSLSDTIDTIKTLSRLHFLDLRQNPITSKLYPQVKTMENPASKASSDLTCYLANEHDTTWMTRDTKFVQKLPMHWNERRLIYRAVVLKCRPNLTNLDGLSITDEELQQAEHVVATLNSNTSATQDE